MNSVIFFLLVAVFNVALSAQVDPNALGPVRSCQCYLNNVNLNIPANVLSNVKSLGPAEICHCAPSAKTAVYPIGATMPASVAMPMTAPVSATGPMHAATMPKSIFSSSLRQASCPIGHTITGKYTVDDTSKLFMCGQHVSYGSINQLTDINLVNSHYPCADFFFELRNYQLSSGLAFGIEVYGKKYVAVGSGSPSLPVGYTPLEAYAEWTFGSCENVIPEKQAVFVSSLVGSNGAFQTIAKDYGAFPIGVQDGFVYPGGLQCIRIQNPFCVKPVGK